MKRLQVFYYVWHLIIFITTAAAGVVIPLFLAFNLQVDLKFYLFDIFVMIIFIIDVLLSSQKLFKANLE